MTTFDESINFEFLGKGQVFMNVSRISEAAAVEVKPGRKRRILHTDRLMMVAFDFADGPSENSKTTIIR